MNLLPAFTGAPAPNAVYNVDALTLLRALPAGSVDAIISDLPYGTTACAWDTIIPFADLWDAVRHALKPRGVFVTTASQPFTSALVMSNPAWFHEELIWNKVAATRFLDASRQHLKQHENVLVFCEGMPTYNPQMQKGAPYIRPQGKTRPAVYGAFEQNVTINPGNRYPKTIVEYSNADKSGASHSTQKPVALYEYLIRTYTQPGELVVDPCCGSGTTALAARNTGRAFVCGDTSPEYVAVARRRLAQPYTVPMFQEAAL